MPAEMLTYPIPQLLPAGGASYPIPEVDGRYIKPTTIKLGPVYLDVPTFTWVLLPGPLPFTCQLDVFPGTHRQLQKLGVGPHQLEVIAPSGVDGDQRLIIKQVFLRDDRPSDEARSLWRVSDRRMWLDYSKYSGLHNLRRKVNDREALDPQTLFGYNVEAYRPYSAFTAKDKDGNETKKPWTALGLLHAILKASDPKGIFGGTFDGIVDNGVPVESMDTFEERPSMLLTELFRLAEVSCFVNLEGYYEFFDRTVETLKLRMLQQSGVIRGRLINQDNKRTRPSSILVRFREERETDCTFEELAAPNTPVTSEASKSQYEKIARDAGIKIIQQGGDESKERDAGKGPLPSSAAFLAAVQAGAAINKTVPKLGDPIKLENVVQLPLDLSVNIAGLGTISFNRGEYIRLDLALAAWEILDRQSADGKPLKYLTLANLQRYWFGNLIGRVYTFNKTYPTWVDPIKADRINAVRESYRRIFRFGKPWLDNIHKWSPRRVTIVDPITRTRALPFISGQYCEVPNMRPPVGAQKQARVVAVNIDDYSTTKQSPFIINEVDADLGVVVLEPMRDLTGVVRERIRGLVNNIPRYDLNPDGSILWQNASLKSTYKLRFYVTVEWGAPNNKDRLFIVKKDVKAAGGQGGLLEIGSSIDTARIDKDGNVVNAELLAKIADYETRQIMFSHRDVGIGYVHFSGLRTKLKPEGFARGVSFVVENGFAYTMYDLTEPYTSRPPQAMMDPALRRFAYRVTEVK